MNINRNFLKHYSHSLSLLLRTFDISVIIVSAIVAFYFTFSRFPVSEEIGTPIIIGILVAALSFNSFAVYKPWRGISITNQVWVITQAWTVTASSLVALLYFLAHPLVDIEEGRNWVFQWIGIGWLLLIATRIMIRNTLDQIRSRGFNKKHIILVGLSKHGVTAATHLVNSSWSGFNVKGYVDDRGSPRNPEGGLTHLGSIQDLESIIERHNVEQVWITYPQLATERIQELLHELRHIPVTTRIIFDAEMFGITIPTITEIAGIPVLDILSTPLEQGVNRQLKTIEDFCVSAIMLTVLSPLMIAIAIGVKLSSPGPVFFRQERISWNNKKFNMLKFRSMPATVEQESGPVWAKKGETRATAFGSFLRKTSLDELPQFINVLMRDMSIIGPRPERTHFAEEFKHQIPNYMKKHMVKAGITGWAQVNGFRGDTDLDKRIEYDLFYIQHWSLEFDIKIAIKTLFTGFINKHAY